MRKVKVIKKSAMLPKLFPKAEDQNSKPAFFEDKLSEKAPLTNHSKTPFANYEAGQSSTLQHSPALLKDKFMLPKSYNKIDDIKSFTPKRRDSDPSANDFLGRPWVHGSGKPHSGLGNVPRSQSNQRFLRGSTPDANAR